MMRHSLAALLLILCACSDGVSSAGAPSFVFRSDRARGNFGAIEIEGVNTRIVRALARRETGDSIWRHFAVYTGDAAPTDARTPVVTGSYAAADGRLRFIPTFPPMSGQPYYVRFDGAAIAAALGLGSGANIDTVLVIPRDRDTATTFVMRVDPGVDTVPENLLKLYVGFSAPMSIGFAREHLRLLDDAGVAVEDAFLNVPQELWDPERRRITVLFDPGRIKRDLRPHEELGLPLRPGRRYTLVIDSMWQDAQGRRLHASHRKTFDVVAADREIPRVAAWTVSPPRAGTTDALTVAFPEPLDRALLARVLTVRRADDRVLMGVVEVDADARRWSFVPAAAWTEDDHTIAVGTELEDLAGNNLRKLFDVDRNAPSSGGATGETVTIPFRPRR